jgi:GT2 family glycosyltransferase
MAIRAPVASLRVEGPERIAVVAVVVVHEPGDWFAESLAAFAAQSYRPLQFLFLLSSATDVDAVGDQIRAAIPSALVQEGDPSTDGFGRAANRVLELVEGENGLFCLMHDDVAPADDAIGHLVDEFHRSNAGLVGPKLVAWDEPQRILEVGFGLDRFGEIDHFIEPGELDQEQHDAVRDVFVLPSACILVRADLLRSLGGFEPSIDLLGEDVDLCWRAHWAGARVVVAPDAVVRHRSALAARRPDIDHARLSARRRIDTVLSLTGSMRLVPRILQLLLLTIAEAVIGLFTGRGAEAWNSIIALLGVPFRWRSLAERRRRLAGTRAVDEIEVLGLQSRGSARLSDFLRSRDTEELVAGDTTVRRWRQRGFAVSLTWLLIVVGLIVGSRGLILGREPWVGRLLPLESSVADLLGMWWSSWDPRGIGSTTSPPGGYALLAALRAITPGGGATVLGLVSVGTVILGLLGIGRLLTVFPSERARVAGLAVYGAAPLVPSLFRRGDVDALVIFAALPWIIHLGRRLAGIATADSSTVEGDLPDGLSAPAHGDRRRLAAGLVLICALGGSISPPVLIVGSVTLLAVSVATVAVGAGWRTASWFAAGIPCVLGSWFLLLPWSSTWSIETLTGAGFDGVAGRGFLAAVSFGDGRWVGLSVALYLAVLTAVMITRAWRLTWSVRGALLTVPSLALVVLADRGVGAHIIPAREILLVPALLGVAIAAAGVIGGFGSDVLTRVFSWRQPLVIAAQLGLVIGLIPGVIAIGDGEWDMPSDPIAELAASQFPPRSDLGSYRVLWVGDPRVLPIPATPYAEGIGFAVSDAGPMGVTEAFPTVRGPAGERIHEVLDLLAIGSTARVGRLLAPLGVRYVVVPLADGIESSVADPLPTPAGLLEALAAQLDIGAVQSPPTIEVFVNRAWIPPAAYLEGAAAEASARAGEGSLLLADVTGVSTIVDDSGGAVDLVDVVASSGPTLVSVPGPGVLHLGVPFDGTWAASMSDVELEARAGFGLTTAFDLPDGGQVLVEHVRPGGRTFAMAAVSVLWIAVGAALLKPGRGYGRKRRGAVPPDTAVLTLDGSEIGVQT